MEHYRSGDPERGCGMGIVIVLVLAILFWGGVVWWLLNNL